MSPQAVRNLGWRYVGEGLGRALYEKSRPGQAQRIGRSARGRRSASGAQPGAGAAHRALSPGQAQRIGAMVCGPPPEGRARWSVRLITQEAMKRHLAPTIGRETIRVLLQQHDLKPWRE